MDGHGNFSHLSTRKIVFSFTQRFSRAQKPIKPHIQRVFCVSLSGARQPERQVFWPTLKGYWTHKRSDMFREFDIQKKVHRDIFL